MNSNTRRNLFLNVIVAISFLLTLVSGIYFFFTPEEGKVTSTIFLFSKTTWDLVHTWSGVVLMVAATVHIAIHWKWITKVSGKMVKLAGRLNLQGKLRSIPDQ